MMQWKNTTDAIEQIQFAQQSADALCDLRVAAAPLIAEHILTNENYQSWALAGIVSVLFATDKVDGRLAKFRDSLILKLNPDIDNPSIQLSDDLLAAISQGGRKDDKADKVLTHSLLFSIAGREIANGHHAYGSLIAGADSAMFARDYYVGNQRDKAATNGVKGDARSLGKWKQAALVATTIVAVSPLANANNSKNPRSFGRIGVCVGMLGSLVMSGISGVDQVRNLKQRQRNKNS